MDEADRMIEANFEGFISNILDAIPMTNLKSSAAAAAHLGWARNKE